MSLSLFNLILICSFIAWKNQSAWHAQKSVTTAFCSRVASDILRSSVVCLKQLFVQPSGTKELAFHAITATGWTPLKQHLSYSAAWTAVCCDFIGAGFLFRITYARENCALRIHWCALKLLGKRASVFLGIVEESSCKWVQRINLFILCRVQLSLREANVWA